MNRVRWMRAEWPSSMRTLANRMKKQAYTYEGIDGFVIDRVRDTHVEARYIEKLSYQEIVTDPFGAEQVYDRVAYRSLSFSLFSSYPQVELYDAHRSTRGFVTRLLEICQFSVVIEPLSIDLVEWADNFQKLIKRKVLINSVQIAGLELEQGITAKILLKGGRDVRGALKTITGRKSFTLEKLQMQYSMGSSLATVDLSSTGTVKIKEGMVDELAPFLRNSLPKTHKH